MKKISAFLLTIIILFVSGCSAAQNADTNNSNADSSDDVMSLKSAVCDETFDFNDNYVQIGITAEYDYYCFSNRNQSFFNEILDFLTSTHIKPTNNYEHGTNELYITFCDSNFTYQSLNINEKDQVCIYDGTAETKYSSEGVYNKLIECLTPHLKSYEKYCRAATTPILHMYEYAVYDKDGQILESDSVSKEPYLFWDGSNTVHIWGQRGTVQLTRWARFFDVESGKTSPAFYGQTDYLGELVCAAESGQVGLYDMFSGKLLYCFDKFDKPTADDPESIISAYFSNDGKELIVCYYSSDGTKEKQVFDVFSIKDDEQNK